MDSWLPSPVAGAVWGSDHGSSNVLRPQKLFQELQDVSLVPWSYPHANLSVKLENEKEEKSGREVGGEAQGSPSPKDYAKLSSQFKPDRTHPVLRENLGGQKTREPSKNFQGQMVARAYAPCLLRCSVFLSRDEGCYGDG